MKQGVIISVLTLAISVALAEFLMQIALPSCPIKRFRDPLIGEHLKPNLNVHCSNGEFSNTVITNALGFHDFPREKSKTSGLYRVVVIGDSFVEGVQVSREQNLTYLISQALQESIDIPVEVLNMGVSGNGVAQYLAVLEHLALSFKPDLVIFAVLPSNDFSDSSPLFKNTGGKPYYRLNDQHGLKYIAPMPLSSNKESYRDTLSKIQLAQLVRKALRGSSLERLLAKFGFMSVSGSWSLVDGIPTDWHVFRENSDTEWQEAYKITLTSLATANRLVRGAGAQFLTVLIPSKATVEGLWDEALAAYGTSADAVDWNLLRPFAAIEQLAQREGFSVVNLLPEFQRSFNDTQQSGYWKTDGHWNPAGHKLAARILNDPLLSVIQIRQQEE